MLKYYNMIFQLNIGWTMIYTQNDVSTLQNIIIVLSRNCRGIHKLGRLDHQFLYVCLMWDIGSKGIIRPVLLFLFLHLSLQCYYSPLFSIPASYHQYWVHFLKTKEYIM